MFSKAVVRLTLWYLAVIMLLSVMFSAALYDVSTSELDALQHRQEVLLQSRMPGPDIFNIKDFNQQRINQIEDSKQKIEINLVYFNLVILLIGGGISFLLAHRTLRPIEEALEAQNRFTADASHELRTPLTVMKTEIEVALRSTSLTLVEAKELLGSNLEEIGKLESLSNGLLRLAKQETTSPADFQDCSVKKVIDDAISRTSKAAASQQVTVVTDHTEATVHGECWSLTELITVLLDNAIKYSPVGGEVRITTRVHARGVEVAIRDNGCGIKASDLPYIFNRFYRADRSRSKEKIEGYGLGLSIAKKIIDAHGGRIEVESIPQKGSTFKVFFS